MQVRSFIQTLRRRWLWIFAITVICTAVSGGLAYKSTKLYQATAKVYFSVTTGISANELQQGSSFIQSQVPTYATLAKTPLVLDPVISSLKLHKSAAQLSGEVSSSVTPNTVLVAITVTDPSGNVAAAIANKVADQLGVAVRGLVPKDAHGQPTVTVATVSPAHEPKQPSSPKTTRDVIAAFVGGLLLGIAFAMTVDLWASHGRGFEISEQRPLALDAEMDSLDHLSS